MPYLNQGKQYTCELTVPQAKFKRKNIRLYCENRVSLTAANLCLHGSSIWKYIVLYMPTEDHIICSNNIILTKWYPLPDKFYLEWDLTHMVMFLFCLIYQWRWNFNKILLHIHNLINNHLILPSPWIPSRSSHDHFSPKSL